METATRVKTDQHKAAIAQGRIETSAVRAYLEWLKNNKPKRGRKRTVETINARIIVIDAELGSDACSAIDMLRLTQERIDLAAELDEMVMADDAVTLEANFIKHAAGYGAKHGISYVAWLQVGVPAAVLKQAGISRK